MENLGSSFDVRSSVVSDCLDKLPDRRECRRSHSGVRREGKEAIRLRADFLRGGFSGAKRRREEAGPLAGSKDTDIHTLLRDPIAPTFS